MATATIISYPEALCMAGNIQPVRVSAAGLFTFRLKKGGTVLLEEDYVPDASGQAEIDIRDLVLSDLSLSLPSADVFKQTAAAASYTISTDTDSRTFKAVLGGIDRPATDAATFLKTNFLTWQPQLKSVTYGQPEWLSFYTPATAVSLKAKFYLKDGTTSTVTVAAATSFDPGCVYSVNVRFSRLWSMGEGDRYGMVDVWLEDDQSTALTYVQRYVLDTSGDERTVLVARNSLGGIDTFSFLGSMERSAEAEHTNVMRGETMYSGLVDMTRTYTVNTGILSGHGRDWVWDLQRSTQAWVLMDGALRGIVMLAPAVTASMYEDSTGTVDFLLCDDSGYLNMPRLESHPENIEVSGPDGEVFFLAPRLADYPDASLDDSLLLPVQSPAAQEWSKLSVAALSSYILSAVDDKYGEFLHVHDNLQVLGKLSVDDNGRLMYDGSPVGDSGLTEHDHHGETIRPEKIVVGTVEITCVDGRLHVSSTVTSDGDFVAYGDDEGGTAGGGLDVARLWEELKAEDASKVIDVSHIPGSVVLQDELTEILDDYPLTTEVNTALGGKADKDWVEEELAKYVTLSTDQNVTGVKTFTNGIKIGGVTLSAIDGRLHVSSTVTSDGDFVAYGDDEGGTAGGGLDVTRLWEELKAEDASKVIDVSHIPGSVVLQDELVEILDDYPLTTEVNTALGKKANKDWVEEELAKYLLLTGGKISGDLEVAGTIKIGDAVLSYAGGRLHVSSSVASDGDFVAYGDDEGGTAGGGLDVTRLWEELKAEDASKVIDVSHIPGSVVLQDELTEILDDYPLITEMNTALAGKASLQHSHAITDITNLQAALSSKWVWDASQIAGVKVNNAVAADKLATARKINGTEFLGTQDITTAKWGMARSMRIGDYYGSNGAAVSIDGSGTSGYVLPLPQSIKVKTLDVDGVTLSVVDGRLHISATATSAGDFVAFGDEEGSGGSGGLDISRLWEELRVDDSSKVIDLSHIPAIPTSKITGLDNALSGYVSSVTTSGAGNAVTGYAKNGNTLTLVKGTTFLTSVSLATISDLHSSWDAVLKVAKPAWLTSVSLATISDLNSSWDALLKVAPTKYVTRWPTASEVGALTQATADGRYLRLSGGTMSGDITFSAGAIYLGTADGFDRTIVGYNETSGAMLFFDGTRTVVGSYGAHSTAATHIRSKTGHATIGAGNTASYTILDTGNYTGVLDSRYVNVSGDTLTGPLKYISNGNRYLTLSEAGLSWDFSDVTGGHAHNWLRVTEPDGSRYTGMGVYGGTDGLTYIYLGGTYTVPWIVLRPSGNVGIGITSPSYKLHVGGNAYISGTIYASSSFNLTSSRGRFVFDSSSDATWLQGMAGKNMAISAMNGGTLPKLSLYADLVQANHDLAVSGSVKIGSIILTDSGGRLHVSSTVTSDGDFVAFGDEEGSGGSGGLDVARLWEELVAKDSSKIIDASHIPNIDVSKVTGLSASRALVSNASGKVDVSAVTATELGYLDGVTSKIQTQLNNRVTLSTTQTITGLKYFARDAASVLYVENTASTSTSDYAAVVFRKAGSNIGILAANAENNYLYRANPAFSAVYRLLDTGNYTSTLDSRYMRIGSSGYPTAYRKVFNLNGTVWSFLGTTTDAPTAYAPTTAGTSGYVLQSTGGTPAWAAQNSLVVKGIYERSLGVAAGDTMADLKSALTTQMGSGLNKPGSMGFVTATSVANIMSNWANDDYELVAGARTNFLRLDGYGSSTYGVFLVSGYQGSFYRLLKNSSTAWGGPYLILDTGNYANTLDSRYMNVSGDTMTGVLTLGDSSRLNFVVGGTARTAVYDDGDYTIFGDPDYKACIRGSRIIFQNATGSNGLVMEGDTFTFKGNSIWHAGNDGPGSGLNADQLDGYQASSFLLKSGGTMTGTLTVPSLYVNSLAYIYESASHATRLTMQWSGGIARIYAISNSGSGYYDMSLGQTPGNSGALYFDASAARWGIGTTSPAYKLDVAGTLRATGQGAFDTIKITDNTSAAHLTFGRTDAFNYISLPGDSSTLAIAPGGDTSGAGSALCISNSATYPGYHNGTIALGTSSYRWSNVYSVLGNFSGLVTAGSIAVTDKLYIPSPDGNQRYYIKFE